MQIREQIKNRERLTKFEQEQMKRRHGLKVNSEI